MFYVCAWSTLPISKEIPCISYMCLVELTNFDYFIYLELPRQYKKDPVCEENLNTSRQFIPLSQNKLMNYHGGTSGLDVVILSTNTLMYTVIVPYSLIHIHIKIYTIQSPNEQPNGYVFVNSKNESTLCSDNGFIINLSDGHTLYSSHPVKSKTNTDYAQCKFCLHRLFFVANTHTPLPIFTANRGHMIFHCKTEDLYIQTFHNETVDFCVKSDT